VPPSPRRRVSNPQADKLLFRGRFVEEIQFAHVLRDRDGGVNARRVAFVFGMLTDQTPDGFRERVVRGRAELQWDSGRLLLLDTSGGEWTAKASTNASRAVTANRSIAKVTCVESEYGMLHLRVVGSMVGQNPIVNSTASTTYSITPAFNASLLTAPALRLRYTELCDTRAGGINKCLRMHIEALSVSDGQRAMAKSICSSLSVPAAGLAATRDTVARTFMSKPALQGLPNRSGSWA
jgi:hypothetical protein